MRSIIVPLIFAVCSLLSTAIYASEGGSDTKVPDKTIVLYDNIPSGRPNAPSRVYIECTKIFMFGVMRGAFYETSRLGFGKFARETGCYASPGER